MSDDILKTLSPTEEQHYLSLCKLGDEYAKKVLIQHNADLVLHIAKKYTRTGFTLDDLIQIGTTGLIKAVNNYNSKETPSFHVYAAKCIENEILMTIRISNYEKIKFDDMVSDLGLYAVLIAVNKVLTPSEKFVIENCYLTRVRRSMRKIASLLDISYSHLSYVENNAISKLKAELYTNYQIKKDIYQRVDNDTKLDVYVKTAVALELGKRKDMNAPIVRYNKVTGEVFHEMPNGELIKVGNRLKRGRYSERKK